MPHDSDSGEQVRTIVYMRETVFSPSRKGQGFCGVPGIQEGQPPCNQTYDAK